MNGANGVIGGWRELSFPAAGGLSVLELSGAGALACAARLCGRAPKGLRAGRARLAELRNGAGELLDEALVVVRGARCVELHLHGSRAAVAAVAAELGRLGLAARGELERGGVERSGAARASLEHRALERAARVRGSHAAALILRQASGSLRARLERACLAAPAVWRAEVDALLDARRRCRHLLDPPRVVLAGPANAGKSTLFNALLGEDRALVSERAGTTRDALAEPCVVDGIEFWLFDTAGRRDAAAQLSVGEAAAVLERRGQQLGAELAAAADLVLELVPPSGLAAEAHPPTGPGPARVVRLHARGDLAPEEGRHPDALRPVERPAEARATVSRALRAALGLERPEQLRGLDVPLESEFAGALAALRDARATTARRRALAPWLGTARRIP